MPTAISAIRSRIKEFLTESAAFLPKVKGACPATKTPGSEIGFSPLNFSTITFPVLARKRFQLPVLKESE